jgi:hypothetical protein
MKRQNLVDRFPTFFTYCCFQITGALLLFAIYRFSTPEAYFYAYWVNTGLGAGLGFFVIREAFVNILKPYPGLRDAGMLLFRFAAVLLVLFAAVSYVGGTGNGIARIAREITSMQRNVMLIQAGLLVFVTMCSNYLNISWKSFPAGILTGMGIFASCDLISSNILAARGFLNFSKPTLTLLMQITWLLASASWMAYAWIAEPERKVERERSFNPVLDRWNQAAMLIMNSEAAEPAEHTYLSDIERTVESVLATSSK